MLLHDLSWIPIIMQSFTPVSLLEAYSFTGLAGEQYSPLCTHARMVSGRGNPRKKYTSGHSRQILVSQPGMLG